MNIQEENYKKMEELGLINVINEKYIQIINPPYLKYTVEILWDLSPEKYRIGMTHWSEQNGDLMHNPDMECVINTKEKTVSARTYQQDFCGVYSTAEIGSSNPEELDKKTADDLDNFLSLWLTNLKDQGYGDVLKSENKPQNRVKRRIIQKLNYLRHKKG